MTMIYKEGKKFYKRDDGDLLVKFCTKKTNPLRGCDTLQIGTLKKYRAMEQTSPLADKYDGVNRCSVLNYSSKNADKQLQDQVHPFFNLQGSSELQFNNCQIELSFPNSFIYCLSLCNKAENLEKKATALGYHDYFIVTNEHECANEIGCILNVAYLENRISIDQEHNPQNVCVSSCVFPVRYSSDKHQVIVDSKPITPLSIDLDPFERSLFTKDERFVPETEIRMSFLFADASSRVLPVTNEHIRIPAHGLMKYFKKT